MKNYNSFAFVLVLAFVMLLTNCGTTAAVKDGQKPERIYQSLFDMLRAQPELTISGSASDATIRIRGNTALQGNNDPLFVVNGNPVGNGFSNVQQINVTDVESIRVLPRAQAGIYGARGVNGVIVIKTK
jgi:TonB-dependent SusC/RagA subfamily outer membrane receptor